MANLPGSIGYITVSDNVFDVSSDSTDTGDVPDISQSTATVTFVPRGLPANRPYLIAAGSGQRVHVEPVTCFLANGQLYRPADGSAPAAGEVAASLTVTLLAPQQASLDLQNWYWEAQYAPANGSLWAPYTISVTGKPGDAVVMSQAALVQDITAAQPTVRQALAWYVTPANTANPPLVSDLPSGYRVGDTVVDISKTPWVVYLIGA